jgi:hypothetical protein
VVNLPQRFQVVNASSPLNAGYRLLAFTVSGSLGSAISGILMQKVTIAPFYILVGSALVQTVGLILMSQLPILSETIQSATYGYELILGIGLGSSIATVVMFVPLVVERKDSGKQESSFLVGSSF